MEQSKCERENPGKLPSFVLKIYNEVKPEHGEDNYCHAFCQDGTGLLAVFDGCGGSGAFRHAAYTDHTEAYMASRMCAGTFLDCFVDSFPRSGADDAFARSYCDRVQTMCARVLDRYAPPSEDGPVMKGRMVRTLPTTAAAALVTLPNPGSYCIYPIWAGDSRVYTMTADGLAQLTQDDCSVADPFENLYQNGSLKNFISQGRPVVLNIRRVDVARPMLVMAASDGCFGYYSTPMEFEGTILRTLMQVSSLNQWEQLLKEQICAVAGDDVSLILAGYGYGSFEQLQQDLKLRHQLVEQQYMLPLSQLDPGDRDARLQLWQSYKTNYLRCLEGN